MNCTTAHAWLLASRPGATPPPEVADHLGRCPDCRRQRQRLQRLHQAVRALPLPPDDPAARARILRRLEPLPVTAPAPPWPRRLVYALAFAAAAVVWLLLGVGLGRLLSPTAAPPASVPEAPVARSTTALPDELVASALGHHLRLAEARGPEEQVRALGELAVDLRGSALGLARRGALEDLPLVTGLYDCVVRQGLVGRARALPAERRRELVPGLARQLRDGQAEATRAADEALPAAGDLLRALAATADEAAQALLADRPAAAPVTPPASPSGTRALLRAAVLQGVRLVEEEDALRRADSCQEVADRLADVIVLASAAGDAEQATRLGERLGAVMERGVAGNLARVAVKDLDDARLEELERLEQRAARMTAGLERNLERAPAPARAGLQRALESSHHGREKASQAGKGRPKDRKGPPGKPEHGGPKK